MDGESNCFTHYITGLVCRHYRLFLDSKINQLFCDLVQTLYFLRRRGGVLFGWKSFRFGIINIYTIVCTFSTLPHLNKAVTAQLPALSSGHTLLDYALCTHRRYCTTRIICERETKFRPHLVAHSLCLVTARVAGTFTPGSAAVAHIARTRLLSTQPIALSMNKLAVSPAHSAHDGIAPENYPNVFAPGIGWII